MENTIPDSSVVTEQLERLVNHRALRQSRRLVLFLRYIVETTLKGKGNQLKERNVGTDVFGKGSRYDPAIDSTVRVAASELRKRLALYYQEPEHAHELHFSLPLGTYTPTFQWPSEEDSKDGSDQHAEIHSTPAAELEPDTTEHAPSRARRFPWLWAGMSALVLVIVASFVLVQNRFSHGSVLDAFWGPVLHSKSPVLVLVAGHPYSSMYIRDAQNPARLLTLNMGEPGIDTVTFDDMESLTIITGFLRAHDVHYEVRDESTVTISDLRNGPVVLIGTYCNSWTLRLLKPLRFHFGNDPSMTSHWIEDRESKTNPKWIVYSPKKLATYDFVDYAIVGRYEDNNLGQPVVIVSGMDGGNNINAAKVITDRDFLAQLFGSLNAGRGDKNFEAVISAETVNEHVGQPRIEASYSW